MQNVPGTIRDANGETEALLRDEPIAWLILMTASNNPCRYAADHIFHETHVRFTGNAEDSGSVGTRATNATIVTFSAADRSKDPVMRVSKVA